MAKQSLFQSQGVSQAPQNTGLLSMPQESGSLNTIKPRDDGPFAPYVEFAVTGKGRWDAIKEACPGVQDCDPILRLDGEYTRQVPLVYFLVDGFQYFALLDAEYKPCRAWREKPAESVTRERTHEYMQLLAIVLTPQGPVAATLRARDGICRGVAKSINARTEAMQPAWAEKSPDHMLTMKITDPRFRFKTELRPGHGTNRSTGRSYQISTSKILPATVADIAVLGQTNPDQLALAKAEFDKQKAAVDAMITKG